jgi:hydroxylaminobenzene mutase
MLFFLGLLSGCLVPVLNASRLAMAAHLEGLLNGMFLILVGGVVWKELRLSEGVRAASFWLLLVSAYASWGFCQLAAFFGASRTLVIAGAGHSAAPWQENLVSAGLGIGACSVLIACCLVLYGLRKVVEA